MAAILLVRSRQEVDECVLGQLRDAFGEDIQLIDVEPRTPEELHEMCRRHKAVAVVLRENPLPIQAMVAGIPCIPIRPGGGPLVRLVSIEPVVEPL